MRRLPVGENVVEAILTLVRSARPGPEAGDAGKLIAWGPGPRASQSLMLAVRARALLDGRLAPSIDDVLALAEPVLQAPHGADLRRARRRPHHSRRDQAVEDADRLMAADDRAHEPGRSLAIRRADGESRTLAASLPRLDA